MEQITVKKERVNIFLIREIGVVTGTILLFLIFTGFIGRNWVSIASLKPLLHVASLLGVMVIGQSLLIISGEFDLSVGSVFGLAGITMAIDYFNYCPGHPGFSLRWRYFHFVKFTGYPITGTTLFSHPDEDLVCYPGR